MSDPELDQLHQRLLAGDPAAAGRIAERVLEKMKRIVTRAVPSLTDPHDAEEACLNVLLDYFATPSTYNPQRSALLTYLTNAARYQALSIARKHSRRRKNVAAFAEAVREQRGGDDNVSSTEEEALDAIWVRDILEEHGRKIVEDDVDTEVFLLSAAGVRYDTDYLEHLGWEDTPENRAEIKARRERIRVRLRRLRKGLENG